MYVQKGQTKFHFSHNQRNTFDQIEIEIICISVQKQNIADDFIFLTEICKYSAITYNT